MKLVHFYGDEIGMPSEMEANWKSQFFPHSALIVMYQLIIIHSS
jgi:hypothetical protein